MYPDKTAEIELCLKRMYILTSQVKRLEIWMTLKSGKMSDDDRMSLTTAVSDEEDAESVHNSPYRAKQTGTAAASFNCTGAVRKAGPSGHQAIVEDLKQTIAENSAVIESLKTALEEKDRHIRQLQMKVDDLEQYQRRQCLRIFGVSESESENTETIATDVAPKIGVQLTESDIDRSHRVGRRNKPNTTPSELWKNLKVIGLGRASEQADIPIPLDLLNEHFVKDPTLNNTTKQDTVLPDSAPPTRDKSYFTDVTPIDVMKAIRRIKTKAQGPDNISILLIQKIQDIVIPTIAHIFNSSLITSTFPKIWKQAFVLPLPKVKVPTDPNDYRPISILPAISKALERIVHRQITNYMNEHKLFDKYQSGFRAGHNTSTALLKVTEDIREAIDSNKVIILTLLDLSKLSTL
ncbi:hypothetical protein ANN_13997 [Periplaneta americana]|uniref:Reverse transcriptase domain-containing protein n=1 Tax=Periplaneta americana TaxID=6978 RepID=A0ABQ8SV27_PERAM|nr:hypothetical protein ANN_13997 [Periplaneta americana]